MLISCDEAPLQEALAYHHLGQPIKSLHSGKFVMLLLSSVDFLSNELFQIFFQEHYDPGGGAVGYSDIFI